MGVGGSLLKGLGIGITVWLAVVGCMSLFNVGIGDLPFGSYATCLVAPDAPTSAPDCGWSGWSIGSGAEQADSSDEGLPSRVIGDVREWGSTLWDASLTFGERWILPISKRLAVVADFVGDRFFRR